jgi:uncharacterized repeat protein (TIGR01451 family)
MKKFIDFLKRNNKKLSAFIVISLITIFAGSAIAGFGPDRPTKAYTPGIPGFDHVTFNSFTGVPNIGDERNFLTGKIAGADGGFYDPMTKLRANDEVMLRVYVHNNADSSLNASGKGVAKNTKVRVELPGVETITQNHSAKAFISADNAQPQEIYDTIDMKAEDGSAFGMQYIPGSAQVTSNEGTQAIDDAVVAGGVNLGDENGCFEYVKLITLKVKIVAPDYTLEKTVRKDGSTSVNDWKETMKVAPNETVEWRLNFKNTGSTTLKDVVMVDNLPEHTTVVPGSVKLFDTNFPTGYQYPDSAIQANGRQINVNTGTRLPGVRAIVTFKTKVADAKELECGLNTLKNVGYATPANGNGTVTDDATITVDGEKCEEPTPKFEISKDVRKAGDETWKQDVDVEYGDTIQYRIIVKNTGETDLKNVVVKDKRPTGVDYVSGTLKVNGQASTADLFKDGVTIAEIKKGEQAEITFDAKVAKVEAEKCEVKKFRNIASAKPEGLELKEDDANVNTKCGVAPKFECSALNALPLGNNKYQFTTVVKTEGGVTVNKYTYNFGDNSTELGTDKSVVEHQYAKPGEYNVSVRVLFNVGNEQKDARCTTKVVIPTTPVPPTNPPVTEIPKTGAGEIVAGLFGTSATAYGAYAWVASRRALKDIR